MGKAGLPREENVEQRCNINLVSRPAAFLALTASLLFPLGVLSAAEKPSRHAHGTAGPSVRVALQGASTLAVLAPSGGDSVAIGATVEIQWRAQAVSGPVRIELSRDGGLTWEALFLSTANDGAEQWRVEGPETRRARLRITALEDPTETELSNGLFRIVAPALTFTAPAGASTLLLGQPSTLRWNSAALPADAVVLLELSRDGVSWEAQGAYANSGEAAVSFTGRESATAQLRLSVEGRPEVSTLSQPFLLREPTLFAVAPARATVWRAGRQVLIQWTGTSVGAALDGNTVDVQLSRDGGRTWTTLLSGTANDGAQAWGVSGKATDRAVVRVVWNLNPEVQALSSRFSIRRSR